MLIYENFISRCENFTEFAQKHFAYAHNIRYVMLCYVISNLKTRQVLETQRGIRRRSVKESTVTLTSPHVTDWELITVESRLLVLLAVSGRPVSGRCAVAI